MNDCSVSGCDRPSRIKGWCRKHYHQWKRTGNPISKRGEGNARFWNKVEKTTDGCWLWTASGVKGGYGRYTVGGERVLAHRFAYELLVGPIPKGLTLDHLCRNRACVNPRHLEPVTHAENVKRGESGAWLRAKTHCPKGHPYSGDNLAICKGGRVCRACSRERSLAHYYKKKAQLG